MRYLEVLVVEAVLHEVDQIRNHCLSAFCLEQLNQVVVGCREEFDKDLTDYTDTGLLDIKDLKVVKILDDIAAELFELPAGRITFGYEFFNNFCPFPVHCVG